MSFKKYVVFQCMSLPMSLAVMITFYFAKVGETILKVATFLACFSCNEISANSESQLLTPYERMWRTFNWIMRS